MKLKTKIFIVLTLWSLTSDYYSSEQNHEQEVTLKKEQEKKEIQDLFNEIWVLVKKITDNKYYCYNDGFLSMGINNEGKTYVELLRDSNKPYYNINILNDGYIYFYDKNGKFYKKYNLLPEIELEISNPSEKENEAIENSENNNDYIINLLEKSEKYKDLKEPIKNLLEEKKKSKKEERQAILQKVKDKLENINKNTEIQNIKKLLGDMITELKNNIKPNKANIGGKWQSDDSGIFLENDKNKVKIFNDSDILFYYKDNKDNNNQDKKDIEYISYKGINLLGGGISRDLDIDQSKIIQNDGDIEQFLKDNGGDIGKDIITLLKIEKTTVDFATREQILKSIINKLKEKNKNEGLIDAGSEVSQGSAKRLRVEGGSRSVEAGPGEGEGGAGGGSAKSAGGSAKSKWKTWIIGIVVLSSVVLLLLSIYGISRKEENNDKKEENKKVNTEKDTQIEPINIKEDNKTDNEEDNTTDIEEDNTTDSEEDSTDYESN